jgi:hypothetical protein
MAGRGQAPHLACHAFIRADMSPVKARIAETLIILVATLLLLEVGLRVVEALQYRVIQFETYKKIYSDERDKPYLFGLKPNINVKLEKGFYDYTVITNAQGLRETQNFDRIGRSVIFLGDSVVEGSAVENDETMSAVFMRRSGVTTLNFGVGGSNTVQEYFFLREKYRKSYNTKLIVLGFCLNDLNGNRYRRFFDPRTGNWNLYDYLEPDGRISGASLPSEAQVPVTSTQVQSGGVVGATKNFLKKFRVFVVPYELFRSIQAKSRSDHMDAKVSDEDLMITRVYLEKIRNFAMEIGADFTVVILPYESQLRKTYVPGGRTQDQLIPILKSLNISYVDLHEPMQRAVKAAPAEDWFHDEAHPMKIGHQFIGTFLAEEFSKRYPQIFSL